MVIKKIFKNITFVLFISLFIGCKSSGYYTLKNGDYNVKMMIRGPGTCTHLILLNENGNGKIIRGRTLNSYAKEFNKFYDVEFLSYFRIDSKKELEEINIIIDFISTSDLITNSYRLDARRKELFIKGEKKYDVYGWHGEKLIKLLKKLSFHLPYDINSFCTTKSGISDKDKLK